jgi:hypothetical protein
MVVRDINTIRMMRFCMVMGVIMGRGIMSMRMRMDDNLPGSVATAAVLRADLPGPHAFGTFFHSLVVDLLLHYSLLSRCCAETTGYGH